MRLLIHVLLRKMRDVVTIASIGFCLVAPFFTSHDPMATNLSEILSKPSADYWLGTDTLGRDVFSRVLHGGRNTFLTAFFATMIAVLPGGAIGLVSGSAGRKIDYVISTIVNGILGIPGIIIGLVVLSVMEAGTVSLMIATGLVSLANYIQYTRTIAISIVHQEYIVAARSLGADSLHIVLNHITANSLPYLAGYAGVILGYSIVISASFSFLGLGGSPGTPELGAIISEGRSVLRQAPWISIAPSIVIVALVFTINASIDRLFDHRDAV